MWSLLLLTLRPHQAGTCRMDDSVVVAFAAGDQMDSDADTRLGPCGGNGGEPEDRHVVVLALARRGKASPQ